MGPASDCQGVGAGVPQARGQGSAVNPEPCPVHLLVCSCFFPPSTTGFNRFVWDTHVVQGSMRQKRMAEVWTQTCAHVAAAQATCRLCGDGPEGRGASDSTSVDSHLPVMPDLLPRPQNVPGESLLVPTNCFFLTAQKLSVLNGFHFVVGIDTYAHRTVLSRHRCSFFFRKRVHLPLSGPLAAP